MTEILLLIGFVLTVIGFVVEYGNAVTAGVLLFNSAVLHGAWKATR
jgi:hypothetical protein